MERGYEEETGTDSYALTSHRALLVFQVAWGFASFLAEKLCISVRFFEFSGHVAEAEPKINRSTTESQRLSASNAAKPRNSRAQSRSFTRL